MGKVVPSSSILYNITASGERSLEKAFSQAQGMLGPVSAVLVAGWLAPGYGAWEIPLANHSVNPPLLQLWHAGRPLTRDRQRLYLT